MTTTSHEGTHELFCTEPDCYLSSGHDGTHRHIDGREWDQAPELTLEQRIDLASEGMLTADYKRNATARQIARWVQLHQASLPLAGQFEREEVRYRAYQHLLIDLVSQQNGAVR